MSIRRFSPFLTLALVPASLMEPASGSTVVVLRPGPASSGISNGDAFVTTGPGGSLSGNNYGGAGALAVAAPGSAKGAFSSVMRFDISTAKAAFDEAYGAGGWNVESAVLRLTTTMANNPIFNASVPGQVTVQWIRDDSWTEGTGNPNAPSASGLNWNDFPGLLTGAEPAGTLNVALTGDGVTADYPLMISSGFQADLAAGGTVGFAFTPADGSVTVLFNSRSFGTASRNPSLTLTAIPSLPEITGLRFTGNPGHFVLTFTCRSGLKVIPQSSPDLVEWSDSEPVSTVDGINTLTLGPGSGPLEPTRFWRLKRLFP